MSEVRQWGRGAGRPGRHRLPPCRTAALVCAAAVLALTPRIAVSQDPEAGKTIYDKWCAGCHGDTGAGDGVAATHMLPRPRDFTRAVYQIRTTGSGDLPTDADLRKVIDRGMPGTTMPGWGDKLSGGERDDIIAYLKTMSRFFEGADPQPLSIGRAPKADLEEGRRVFIDELQCNTCHGDGGRGDGSSAPTLEDDWGFPVRPADLTRNWTFNGGPTVQDIFWRMRTGLDGTPMPSNWDVVEAEIITEDQLWQVAHYVRSLSPAKTPRPRDVIRAQMARRFYLLPQGVDDPAWNAVEEFFIPLVGQITVAPRQFVPTVDGVWVQAIHNGDYLAIRLRWNDPTRSPDEDWEEFFQGVMEAMTDVDGRVETQGPDRMVVQFPMELTDGPELPFFIGGDAGNPVYRVRWISDRDRLEEGQATGLGTFEANARNEFTHESRFADGEYRLHLTRPVRARDATAAPSFPEGTNIPIAFMAADGTNGGGETRGSISAWYSIYLDVPTPARVYVTPFVVAILTAGLGMMIVWQTQKQHQKSGARPGSQMEE